MSNAGDSATHGEQVKKLAELIKDIQIAMMSTAGPDGTIRSRPMATQKTPFDGTLWFFTPLSSGKVHEIRDDQHVNLSYSEPSDQKYVSVSGTARVLRDPAKAKELWNPLLRAWFPEGLDDPNLGLIKVTVQQAEYWDAPNGAMIQFFGMIKAAITGSPPKAGENEKLNLRGSSGASGSA